MSAKIVCKTTSDGLETELSGDTRVLCGMVVSLAVDIANMDAQARGCPPLVSATALAMTLLQVTKEEMDESGKRS